MTPSQSTWISFASQAAGVLYLVSLAALIIRPALGRVPLALGVAAHTAAMVGRGVAVAFFPLTNKFESFSAAALALALVAVVTWRDRRLYTAPMVLLTLASLATAFSFPAVISPPPPLMRTIWYPLHIPLSFMAYALWGAAAAAGLVWFQTGERRWLLRVDRYALIGLGSWSGGMVCGGVWGVLAWGAYFLWDPKVIWSVILWIHYAMFVHLRITPWARTREWIRPALALVGLAWVFVAYVGTSFFFGGSSHAF